MRKVFLDELPRRGKTNHIDWKKSIGYNVKFIYDNLHEELEIVSVDTEKIKIGIRYKDSITFVNYSDIKLGRLAGIIGKRSYVHTYNTGQILTKVKNGKILILNQIRINNKRRGYIYKCLHCGNQDMIFEDNLKIGVGCNVCAGKKVLKGINDLHTTHPKISKLLKNEKRGYELSAGSHSKEEFICPDCRDIQVKTIKNITRRGFICSKCSDGISYPEKFVTNLLDQLNIDYIKEANFEWAQDKFYDFYIPAINSIIEAHGSQHYDEYSCDFSCFGGRTAEDEQINDVLKKELATENNINNYIVINCSLSELNYMKNSITNSELINICELSSIDWSKCHEYACKNLVKVVCDLWNEGSYTTTTLAKKMKLGAATVRRYLIQGEWLNWCDYNVVVAYKQTMNSNYKKQSKKIVQLSLSGEKIKVWDSIREASRALNIDESQISGTCRVRHVSAGGFRWMYKEDYLDNTKFEINILHRTLNSRIKKVICINTVKIFNSAKEAAKFYNTHSTSIIRSCRLSSSSGKHPETGEPLKWMYVEDYEKLTAN